MSDKDKQPDPRIAEMQLYQRIETARAQIADAVNQTIRGTSLPTSLVLELLRGVVAETTLTLERTAHKQTLTELMELKGGTETVK